MRADVVNDFQLTCSQNNSIFRLPKFVLSVTACRQRHKAMSAARNSRCTSITAQQCEELTMHQYSVSGQLPRQADQSKSASSVWVDDTSASHSSVAMRFQMLGCVLTHVATRLRVVLLGCIFPLVLCAAIATPSLHRHALLRPWATPYNELNCPRECRCALFACV